MKPMATFDPSQPAILRDRFTRKIETWTGEDAADYRENAIEKRGRNGRVARLRL
jgi:hypothetical protein